MAISPVGPPAPGSPLAVQAQVSDFLKLQDDTRRVTEPNETRQTDRDARALPEDRAERSRSERSGQFSNTGTSGTQGGEAGLLSRGPSIGADGVRETRADHPEIDDRVAEARNRPSTEPKEFSIRDSGTVVSRIEIQNPVFDRLKSAMFIDRLDEVRGAKSGPSSEAPVQPRVAGSPSDAAGPETGRFDKRA